MLNQAFGPQTWANWAVVLVAAITGYLIYWQAKETAAAAKATKVAADAALANAQAIVNAERAWIVVSVESPEPNRFIFTAKNEGRSPAKITAIYEKQIPCREAEKLHIPQGTERPTRIQSFPILLPAETSRIVSICNIEELTGRQNREHWLDDVSKGFATVYCWGEIEYSIPIEGPSEITHTTKWLYWIFPIEGKLQIMAAPSHPECNGWT